VTYGNYVVAIVVVSPVSAVPSSDFDALYGRFVIGVIGVIGVMAGCRRGFGSGGSCRNCGR
jgi:hypothetical protein